MKHMHVVTLPETRKISSPEIKPTTTGMLALQYIALHLLKYSETKVNIT